MNLNFFGLALAALCAMPLLARAGTNGFLVPSFRGSTNSQAGGLVSNWWTGVG
ncbi:MAG TPA: hypothetical protein VK846_18910 [Candidatus Limnocylindria bacterium]|nr:hypothetical protein [Candidatus Limnocylindria bacterium]